jgi:hypothetical protein
MAGSVWAEGAIAGAAAGPTSAYFDSGNPRPRLRRRRERRPRRSRSSPALSPDLSGGRSGRAGVKLLLLPWQRQERPQAQKPPVRKRVSKRQPGVLGADALRDVVPYLDPDRDPGYFRVAGVRRRSRDRCPRALLPGNPKRTGTYRAPAPGRRRPTACLAARASHGPYGCFPRASTHWPAGSKPPLTDRLPGAPLWFRADWTKSPVLCSSPASLPRFNAGCYATRLRVGQYSGDSGYAAVSLQGSGVRTQTLPTQPAQTKPPVTGRPQKSSTERRLPSPRPYYTQVGPFI